MYYIFNHEGICIATADSAVNEEDLQTRGEFAVESQEIYDGRFIEFHDGRIVTFEPPREEAPSEPMDSNVLDLATAIIELSDRIDKIEGGQ